MRVSLKAARVNAELTQKEVVERMGWKTPLTLIKIERGERDLTTVELAKLCEMYGCTFADINLPNVSQIVK